jgi:hypothetical protein
MGNSAFTPTFNVSDGSVTEPKLAAGATLKLGTQQASTSGTAIDFTGIPAGTKQITVMLEDVSTNGTSSISMQLGTSSGIEGSSGYDTMIQFGATGVALSYSTAENSILLTMAVVGNADNRVNGAATFTLKNAATNTWVMTGTFMCIGTTPIASHCAGTKSLAAVLDRIRIRSNNGTDAFDAGSINIVYK